MSNEGALHGAPARPVQRDFRVMGCQAHVVVHGGTEAMLDHAEARLRELESLWSRFRDDSDITRANTAAGLPVQVHEDTLAVVARALDAWRQTDGRFDITMLPALLQHGYTHSAVGTHAPAPSVPGTRVGLSAGVRTDFEAGTLTVPATTAIDLGGIGKGFAADIVAEELIEMGATGALVNVGGDLAALGTPSDDTSWYLGIEDPRNPPAHVAVLRLQTGGLATSGTTIRTWTASDGTTAHHLIDPTSSRPSASGVVTATVIAADAATAESFATSAMMLPAAEAAAMLDRVGLAGLLVTTDGEVVRTSTLKDFES
ncbi:MAG: FAD:protein FMN transferase [Actinomycetota bacterium]|nr:FAD:protein FMN transferase [Actinomycetota bacterium]